MYKVDNKKIGVYLKKLIERHYVSTRQFCKAYLELNGEDGDDRSLLDNMANKFSQIIKGKNGLQISDLPIVTELLGISCEELLSAGECKSVTINHVTNYEIANSNDPKVWEQYIQREDKLILNCDEYNKTILDYIFEFRNYPLLRYLMEKEYIWFVDDNKKCDGVCYGADTNIQRRKIGLVDSGLSYELKSQEQLRIKAIILAIEHNDYDILDQLRARENPSLYLAGYAWHSLKSGQYFEKTLVAAIASSGEKMLDYFSQSFDIENQFHKVHTFIYPFLGNVIEEMLRKKRKEAELLVRRALDHNHKIYDKLIELTDAAYKNQCNLFQCELDEGYKEKIKKDVLENICLAPDQNMIYFNDRLSYEEVASTIVKVDETSEEPLLKKLISDLNKTYQKMLSMKGE